MNRSKYFDFIESKLSHLAYRIEVRGGLNILDLNLHSENFYQHFFKVLFGWELQNLNAVQQNAVGVDLVDKNNKYLGKCWIDMSSVSINDAQKREIVAESAENQSRILLGAGDAGLVPFKDGNYAIGYLDALRKGMMGGIVDKLERIPTGDGSGIIPQKTKAVPTGTAGLGGGKVPNKIDPEINGGCRYDGIFEWNKTVIRIGNPNIVVDRLKNTATNNKVYVYAFASKEGTASYNQRLSNNRANSISNILEF